VIEGLISSLTTNPLYGSTSEKSRFIVFGWTKAELPTELGEFSRENGLDYLSWNYGRAGSIFLINSHHDIARNDEAVAIKLGFARTKSFESLSSSDLLTRGFIGPQDVDHTAVHGNVLLICISQREPVFSVYQSLTSTSQMYYWRGLDTVICSDTLRHLTTLVHPLELNQDAVPIHLLYRTVPGEMTYFQGIHKLLSGHMATVKDGGWINRQVERLDDWIPEHKVSGETAQSVAGFESQVERVVGSYVQQVDESGNDLGVLLSGGVDSSLMTSLIKSNLTSQRRLHSFSYAMQVSNFEDEIEYARYASSSLDTQHRFIDITPGDYVDLLEELIDLLAQPINNEQEPCFLALVKTLAGLEPRYLFSGTAADSLLGTKDSKRLMQVERFHRLPGSRHILGFLGRALRHVWPNKAYGMRETAHILDALDDPLSPHHPLHELSMFTNIEKVKMCLDAETVCRALDYRLRVFAAYSSSPSVLEGTHLIALTHDVHDDEATMNQVFRAYDLEHVTPYLDSEFVRATLTFEPQVRYYAQGRSKWLPKQLLENQLGYQTPITRQPKRGGGFDNELRQWMKNGVLQELVQSIERPGYMRQSDFEQVLKEPDWFTWNLLNLDLFQKRLLGNRV
jgi:hypothetical protein